MRLFESDGNHAQQSRGVSAEAVVQDMRATGQTLGGVAREFEFRLVLTPEGSAPVEVVVRQFMNELMLVGLAPGEPASVMYDPRDPATAVIFGSPKYQVVEPGVVVPIASNNDAGSGGGR